MTISPGEVKFGEKVSISVNFANTGDLAGNYDVTLKINNIVVETKKITLAGHAGQKETFTTNRDAAGSYAVSIDTLLGTFTVKAMPTPTLTPQPTPALAPTPINWPLVAEVIGAIVVIGLLIYFLCWRTRLARL